MIDYQPFYQHISNNILKPFVSDFEDAVFKRLNVRSHGDLPQWQAIPTALPEMPDISYQLDSDTVTLSSKKAFTNDEESSIREILMGLHPWRKGPFDFFGINIDTEWRSDWKWQRIKPHISDLADRTVLDVGCGSGYHCWRMRGAGAKFVLGIEPMPKFVFQFQVFKRYMANEPVYLLPLACEDLPANMQSFDTVFSMGVLYHRKSPFEHLEELKQALRPGGELVLETLVIEGPENTVLVPQDRYAQMRNVWFIPSALTLELWLQRLGFVNIRTVDINQTSIEEQRKTEWMTYQSLQDFLDPDNYNRTIEGYPAPRRATLIAEKPAK